MLKVPKLPIVTPGYLVNSEEKTKDEPASDLNLLLKLQWTEFGQRDNEEE